MNHCAVTADLNRYLAEIDAQDRREAIILRRAADLMLEDYNPESSWNFLEAIEEISRDDLNNALTELQLANRSPVADLRNKHLGLFGDKLNQAVTKYWEERALEEATHQIDNAECKHCFDAGCNRCDPPEPDWY